MLPLNDPDGIHVTFDDHRVIASAGPILPLTLAQRLGLGELADRHVDLGDEPGRANKGDKVITLVASERDGGPPVADIDAADALRAGSIGRV